MWHLKTKLGVFWVVPAGQQYFLGINDQELGLYHDVEQAVQDVRNQVTGFLKWDCERQVKAPDHIAEWAKGAPQEWA